MKATWRPGRWPPDFILNLNGSQLKTKKEKKKEEQDEREDREKREGEEREGGGGGKRRGDSIANGAAASETC